MILLVAETETHECLSIAFDGAPPEAPAARRPREAKPELPEAPASVRDEVALRYYPLVDRVAQRLSLRVPTSVSKDDLRSAGAAGLMDAAKRYHPSRDKTFPSYVYRRIMGAMLDELRQLDPIPRRARMHVRKVEAAKEDLRGELGRDATEDEAAARAGLSAALWAKIRRQGTSFSFVSLDDAMDTEDGDGTGLHERLADEEDRTAEDLMNEEDARKALASCVERLAPAERRVVAMSYFEGRSLSEIGAAMGVTESRVCQIRQEAVARLRRSLRRAWAR